MSTTSAATLTNPGVATVAQTLMTTTPTVVAKVAATMKNNSTSNIHKSNSNNMTTTIAVAVTLLTKTITTITIAQQQQPTTTVAVALSTITTATAAAATTTTITTLKHVSFKSIFKTGNPIPREGQKAKAFKRNSRR